MTTAGSEQGGSGPLPRVRMFFSEESAGQIAEVIRGSGGRTHQGERLRDQLWLHTVLWEGRKRTAVAERDAFDERADRILEALDP